MARTVAAVRDRASLLAGAAQSTETITAEVDAAASQMANRADGLRSAADRFLRQLRAA